MQLDLLWKFMQLDMKTDKFENDMRQSANRQKLLKQRSFLMDQQANMKRIEGEIAGMADRVDAIEDDANRVSGLLEKEQKAIEANPPETPEETEKAIGQLQKLLETLSRYEQELQKIRKDSDVRDRQQKEIRVRAAKTKAEFDQLKQQYDDEFKKDSETLKSLRAEADKEGENVAPELLLRYKAIKEHCTPPMAMMVGDQCGGCYMSLPSAMLRDIQSGEKVVECDNCGRIIYVPSAGA